MKYQGVVSLSKHNIKTHTVIEKFRYGKYSREEAALKLGISTRQISRIAKKVREQGISGLLHGNKGKMPSNKLSQEVLDQYVAKYEQTYSKFNYSHALEKMLELEDMAPISYTRFSKACRKKGIGKVKKRRTSKARVARERHYEEGYMWQLDGSPHCWDGKETSTLIALIDDATSKIPNAELHPSETTWACMNVVRLAIERYGAPEFILTDRAGWSSGNSRKRQHFSQFERACAELDITIIATSSPESKGRIERLNRTFQDRLIPELDLFGIRGLKDSNRYINQVFIPSMNEKFSVIPEKSTTRYRKIQPHQDLREIFCLKHHRIVNSDHSFSFQDTRYVIRPLAGWSYKKKEITIHEYENGGLSVYYGSRKLEFEELPKAKRNWDKKAG